MQTNPDMQASGSRGLAHTENEMDMEHPTQKIPDWLQPFTENLEGLESTCSHIPLEERSHIRKMMLQKWRHRNGNTTFIPTSLITKIATYASERKITSVPCRKRNEGSIPRTESLNKNSQETEKSLRTFLEPSPKPTVICTDNSLEFGKSCEESSWNHRTTTHYRPETRNCRASFSREHQLYNRNRDWRTGNLKINEDFGESFWDMLHSGWEIGEEDVDK